MSDALRIWPAQASGTYGPFVTAAIRSRLRLPGTCPPAASHFLAGSGSESERAQKDVEARWTKKNGKSYFGYKNHIDGDAEHKLICTIGLARAEVKIALMNLTYNLMRYLQLTKRTERASAAA